MAMQDNVKMSNGKSKKKVKQREEANMRISAGNQITNWQKKLKKRQTLKQRLPKR